MWLGQYSAGHGMNWKLQIPWPVTVTCQLLTFRKFMELMYDFLIFLERTVCGPGPRTLSARGTPKLVEFEFQTLEFLKFEILRILQR